MADTSTPKSSINPPVFYSSAIVIIAFVLFAVLAPDQAGAIFGSVQSWITNTMGWFYLLSMGIFLIFCLIIAFSRFGSIKLGLNHDEPEYSYLSWFAMLFAAGMGIGIMYFGVAEPVTHYLKPAVGVGQTPEAAQFAMEATFFHWGFHPWAVYAVVALALGYFHFRHGLPLRISSALYPLIGKRIHGPIGYAVDVFAVFGTMFGLATSLGLGALQINSGLNFLYGVPDSLLIQISLIVVITFAATMSVVMGLDSGVKRLSELNLILAILLLLFVMATGATLYMFQSLGQNIGAYLSTVVGRAFNMYANLDNENAKSWISSWTLFYWGWWIAWSPFVGMFIARVSRGRTLRQFILGVLLVPTGFNFIWMTFFGDGALFMLSHQGISSLAEAVNTSSSLALFAFLSNLPMGSVTSVLALLLVATFFVTSADSGALVIDMLTIREGTESRTWQRVFWAIGSGVVATSLLLAGGLDALQTASLAAALPFSIILLVICYGTLKALGKEVHKLKSLDYRSPLSMDALPTQRMENWQQKLSMLVDSPRRQQARQFLQTVVKPAMEDVSKEFEVQGMETKLTFEDDRCYIRVRHGDETDFIYGVRTRPYAAASFGLSAMSNKRPTTKDDHEYKAEVFLKEGGQGYNLLGTDKAKVIADILDQYEKHLHYLQLIR